MKLILIRGFCATLTAALLLTVLSLSVYSQPVQTDDVIRTVVQEGHLRAGYHNVPHIGVMDYIFYPQGSISYQSPDNPYLYFSSLIVGAKVVDQNSGEKIAITIPSAYRTSRDGTKALTFLPVSGYRNPEYETPARASAPGTWPESWEGTWNGYFGEGDIRSSEELYFVNTDQSMTMYSQTGQYQPINDNPEIGGLGLLMETNVFAWDANAEDAFEPLRDSHIIIHRITNNSDFDIDSLVVSNWLADFIGGNTAGDQAKYIKDKSSMLFYDDINPSGIASVKILESPTSDGLLNIIEMDEGALQLDNDEVTYTYMMSSDSSPSQGVSTDFLLSTQPFSLKKDSTVIVAYAVTIEEDGTSFNENEELILDKLDYLQSSYNSSFTLNNVDEVSVADNKVNVNISLDMSSVDTLVNLDEATVNAIRISANDSTYFELGPGTEENIYEGAIETERGQTFEITYNVEGVGLPGNGMDRGIIELDTTYWNDSNVHRAELTANEYFRNIEASGLPLPHEYKIVFGDLGLSTSTASEVTLGSSEVELPAASVNFKINKGASEEAVDFAFLDAHGISTSDRCEEGTDLEPGLFTAATSILGRCSDGIYILSDLNGDGAKEPVERIQMYPQGSLNPNTGDTLTILKKKKERIVEVGYAPTSIKDIFITPSESQNATSQEREPKIARAFKLFQNYPNPFNPTTTIEFIISKPSDVRIDIFNIIGQKIQTLVNGNFTPGSYKIDFNAKNLSTGVYLYKLTVDGQATVRKMLLLK